MNTGRTLHEDFETLYDQRQEVPKLIMEHNPHGIDIDYSFKIKRGRLI